MRNRAGSLQEFAQPLPEVLIFLVQPDYTPMRFQYIMEKPKDKSMAVLTPRS